MPLWELSHGGGEAFGERPCTQGWGFRARQRHRADGPQGLRHEEGRWYLDALDLERGGERTFRLDRMGDVRSIAAASAASEPEAARRGARTVLLTFWDQRYLDLLPWHDLTVVDDEADEKDGPLLASTPFYGGMWLPRMLAACGGAVTTSDRELTALMRSYAFSQLRQR